MRDFATLDLETDPFLKGRLPHAFAGAFFDGQLTTVYWDVNCCALLILLCINEGKKRGGLLVYAHNGGKFDFHFLLSALLEHYAPSDLIVMAIGARIVSIKTPFVEFRDSFSLIPKPLKSFGNKKDIDITKLESSVRDQHRDEIISYLKQDCQGLRQALADFFERYGCEITLASTTFKVLKKLFKVKPIKTGIHYDDKFRDYYFAGRVEFYSLGKHGELDANKRFSICDINSAFPWAMLKPHWFGGEYIRRDGPPDGPIQDVCFYDVHCDSNGCLPRREKGGGVEFPKVTNERFFATGWELFTGIKLGLIKNVVYNTVYQPTITQDFAAYVNYFYEMKRTAANQADRDFAKLFLNSLYGKFALNPREFRDVAITKWGEKPDPKIIERKGKDDVIIPWDHSYDDLQRGLSFWQKPSHHEADEKPMSFYNVCTAASITGCVRAFLQESISASGGVLYTDTDSLMASDVSTLQMSGDILGAWKLEKECDCVWIGGKKLYVAHSINDKGVMEEPSKTAEGKNGYFCKVELPSFTRYYVTKKDYDASWKTASKGVRLKVEDLIAVCEGEARTYSFDAPNYSVFSRPSFTTRTVNRDDKRKKKR